MQWLDHQPPNINKARQSVVRIIRDAERAGQIVGRVRDLVKKAPPQKVWLCINETVEEIISLMRGEITQNRISLKAELSNGIPLSFADRVQLQQVFLNLVVNAIEAFGTVSNGTRELLVSTKCEESDGVLVTVADTHRELAERYMSRSDLSLADIAYLLGFSDQSSLFRASKRWFGTSPGRWGARHPVLP